MGIIELTVPKGVLGRELMTVRADYDFAVQGGAIGTIPLLGATLIPSGATLTGGFVEITTPLTSGGAATAAIQVEAANDIVPAQVLGTWTAGRKQIAVSTGSSAVLAAANLVRTTAKRDISLVIAAFALTAGKFSVILHYMDPLA